MVEKGGIKMKRLLMDIICCPVCKGDLELKVAKEENDEIMEGGLYCKKCEFEYPIEDSIPNLLPPELMKAYDEALKKEKKK